MLLIDIHIVSSKIEMPNLARLGSGPFQLSSVQLGKFQLELITNILLKITFFLRLDNFFSVLIVCLYFQTRGEGCLYLERARDNYQNYDFESRLTVRIHSALRYYSLINEDKIN